VQITEVSPLSSLTFKDRQKKEVSKVNMVEVLSQMAKKHMKKCSPSLTTKEMQIKTTLKFHFTLIRVAIIKNTTTTKCW
jgi:hypothetical protein